MKNNNAENLKHSELVAEESEHDKKYHTLEKTVESDRLRSINFIGKRYYTEEYVREANIELARKIQQELLDGNAEDDEFTHLAEWEFTYALGHEETLQGCRASLASEYDDHINGVDIVCAIADESNKKYVFGVDITTATSPKAVNDKFERGDKPRGPVPTGCSFIKFYQDNKYVACMKGVPRFVLGTSPLFSEKYLNDFQIDENRSIVSHEPNPDLKFNILSSLFLQSSALQKNLECNPDGEEETRDRAINTCSMVNKAALNGLVNLLHSENRNDFYNKLSDGIKNTQNLKINDTPDVCYRNVISESIRRHNEIMKKYNSEQK